MGYIEFHVLCNLNKLNEKLWFSSDLPWFCRYTYHFIGKYDHKQEYMVHLVYICSNMESSFVVQQPNQIEDRFKTNPITSSSSLSSLFVLSQRVHFQEREHVWMMSSTAMTTSPGINKLESRTTQIQERENDVEEPMGPVLSSLV